MWCLAIGALVLLAAACDSNPAPERRVQIRFDNTGIGKTAKPINQGTADDDTAVTVRTLNGGSIRTVASIQGQGRRGDFPAFDDASDGQRAVVRVENTGSGDVMDPGSARFEFGADIRLDSANAGDAPDNGNNVIQRGLADAESQFKLEIDGTPRKARCAVKDAAGVGITAGSEALSPNVDYRIACVRAGTSLSVSVTPLNPDGTKGDTATLQRNKASLGALDFARSTPLSVGGKLKPGDGEIAAWASDQFNGTIDNAQLTIG